MGTPFTGFGNRMAGCFSFRKRWRAVNKDVQKTCTREMKQKSEGVGLSIPGGIISS